MKLGVTRSSSDRLWWIEYEALGVAGDSLAGSVKLPDSDLFCLEFASSCL